MRHLSEAERAKVKVIFKARAKFFDIIMIFFKGFGLLQMLLFVYCYFAAEEKPFEWPMLTIMCLVLWAIYFKLTGFLGKKNPWKILLNAINNKTEEVYEYELSYTYRSGSQRHNQGEFKACVLAPDGKQLFCFADPRMECFSRGTKVAVILAQGGKLHTIYYTTEISND